LYLRIESTKAHIQETRRRVWNREQNPNCTNFKTPGWSIQKIFKDYNLREPWPIWTQKSTKISNLLKKCFIITSHLLIPHSLLLFMACFNFKMKILFLVCMSAFTLLISYSIWLSPPFISCYYCLHSMSDTLLLSLLPLLAVYVCEISLFSRHIFCLLEYCWRRQRA